MADSNLSTSISAIVTELVNKVSTATASELVLLTRAANVIDKTEHSALETAVNSRVNALYSTASVGDLSKLSSAIGNLKEPVVSATSVDLSSVAQHILPVTTNTYNIGSASKLINELHANSVSFVSGTITTTPTNANDLVNKSYVDNSSSGSAFTSDILPNANGTLDIGSSTLGFVNVFASSIQGLTTPANATDAANKAYVDAAVVGISLYAQTVNGYAGTVVLETDDVAEGIFNVYYTDSRVDTHLNTSSATTGQTLIWNGSDYTWGTPAAAGVTQADIDTSIANLVDSAPTTLDTLNELAAALGDDANFSTTITNSIASKLPLAGGTMTGAIDMGSNNITTTGKMLFANVYATTGDLPSASTYHGMFAHVHATGKAYFAHAGAWVRLADYSEVGSGGASVSTSDTAPSSPSDGDMWFDTTDTLLYVYYNDGTSSQWVQSVPIGGSGGSNTPWTSESASYSAVAGKKLLLDTSSTAITVTLPASPAMGDEIRIIDATGNAATNNITINRNGNKIQGQTDNLTVATNRAAFGLVFYNTSNGWLLTEK